MILLTCVSLKSNIDNKLLFQKVQISKYWKHFFKHSKYLNFDKRLIVQIYQTSEYCQEICVSKSPNLWVLKTFFFQIVEISEYWQQTYISNIRVSNLWVLVRNLCFKESKSLRISNWHYWLLALGHTQLPIELVLEVKRPRRQADNWPPSLVEI